ncbi:hypothetical protein CMI42_00970 [Candidatus Pacearchaeota archaeon]|nr:hypothetical protein [Candidatus Pacearchaeota archaeon]|tara:strand:+ start:67 stop:450 length:384 start_codon:yes stop_codon:yes gene_type:complete
MCGAVKDRDPEDLTVALMKAKQDGTASDAELNLGYVIADGLRMTARPRASAWEEDFQVSVPIDLSQERIEGWIDAYYYFQGLRRTSSQMGSPIYEGRNQKIWANLSYHPRDSSGDGLLLVTVKDKGK